MLTATLELANGAGLLDTTDLASRLNEPALRPAQNSEISDRYAWVQSMVNHVPDYIYAKDVDGRFLFANEAVVRDNGMNCVDDIIGLTDFDLHEHTLASSIAAVERRVIETGLPDLGVEERTMKGDRWLMMSRVPLLDSEGGVIGVVGASRDITARKQAEILMKAQAKLLRSAAQGANLEPFLKVTVDLLEELVPGVSAAILLHRGGPTPAVVAASPSAINNTAATLMCLDNGWHTLSVPSFDGAEHGLLAIRGENTDDSALMEFFDGIAQTAGIAIDRHVDAERIAFLAEHDTLTGLPNRALLDRRLVEMLKRADEKSKKVAIVFLDLDNFKLINDSLGHATGDDLLKIVAKRISDSVGDDDMVARIGGDEFILALQQSDEDFAPRVSRVRQAISSPLLLSGMELRLTCSMGMACFSAHGNTPAELFANADMAMYRVKESGRDGIQIYDPSMAENARKKLGRFEELRRAIERDEFVLHYQPQKDMTTDKVIGVEALIRWNHPTEGLMFPGNFISLAEESGLIVPMGEATLKKACHQAMEWQKQGLPPVKMGVNMSARQFQEPGMIQQVISALDESGLDPRWLEIEVTESLLMQDVQGAIKKMHELNALGVNLAIDDFGTGYSSLSTLKSFPLSRLKIDRSFISDIPNDASDMAITAAIISLARLLDLDVIAEGVETEEQAAFLLDSGCNVIQGYLFSKPVPAGQISALTTQLGAGPRDLQSIARAASACQEYAPSNWSSVLQRLREK